MAARNTPKGEIDKLSEKLSKVVVEDDYKSTEKDLFVIAKALVDIFRHWKCNESDCKDYLGKILLTYQNSLKNKSDRPDYRDKCKQWCYMYLFMLNTSYLLFHSVKKAVEDNVININPNGNPLDVCVIGGGPGSDILGLCLLLNEENNSVTKWIRQVNVLDKFVEWEESWKQIEVHLPKHLKESMGNVTYSHFDFTAEALDESNQERIKAAHVVTMTKALSSAAAFIKDTPSKSEGSSEKTERNSVFSILDKMRNGAILLYLDNKKGNQHDILKNAAEYLGCEVLYEASLGEVNVPKYYEAIDNDLRGKLKWKSSRSSNEETFIILKKPGELSEKVKLEAKNSKAEDTLFEAEAGVRTRIS